MPHTLHPLDMEKETKRHVRICSASCSWDHKTHSARIKDAWSNWENRWGSTSFWKVIDSQVRLKFPEDIGLRWVSYSANCNKLSYGTLIDLA